jgi:hypothetical protein
MPTRKDIALQFGLPLEAIEQVGSQQLFKVDCSSYPNSFDSYSGKYYSVSLLVSYRTIVGIYSPAYSEWKVTSKKYSVTTTRQLSQFCNSHNAVRVTEEEFNELLAIVGK